MELNDTPQLRELGVKLCVCLYTRTAVLCLAGTVESCNPGCMRFQSVHVLSVFSHPIYLSSEIFVPLKMNVM
jgi:hypothetical protein